MKQNPTNSSFSSSPDGKYYLERLNQEIVLSNYSKKTYEVYNIYITEFLDFCGDPKKTNKEKIGSFLANKKIKGASTNTILLIYSCLKFFFERILDSKIIDSLPSPKKEKYLPSVLNKKEVETLINNIKNKRNRLIVSFIYSSGARVSEVVNLKIQDINFKEKTGLIRAGKGKKDRIIILSRDWLKEYKKLLDKRKIQSEFLFAKKNGSPLSTDTIQNIIKKAKEESGIRKKVTPHTLRHSFATHMLEKGENIRNIQELLGHSNLNTTQIYTHVSTEQLKKIENPLDVLKTKRKTDT